MSDREEVEEVEHEEVVADETKPAPKKRSRSASTRKKAVKPVTILNNRFVCSYSAQITEKAIFLPGDLTVCFANLPCAFSYIDLTVSDEAKRRDLKIALCNAYEQNVETVQSAPDRNLLACFGGNRSYEEWIGPLAFWNVLTSNSGTTVAEYQQLLKSGGKQATKAAGKVTFEVGLYVVSPKGAPKRVNAVDGAVEKGAKENLTPVRAYRKLHTFIAKQSKENTAVKYRVIEIVDPKDSWRGWGVTLAADSEEPGAEQAQNKVASSLTGSQLFGPAVVFITRKTAVKI